MGDVISSLDTLFPPFREQVEKAIPKMAELDLYVFETYRSLGRQLDRFSQGRTQQNGIWVITDQKLVVTNAKPGMSFHIYGLAFDGVPDGDQQKTGIQWSWKETYIDKQGKIQPVDWKAFGKLVKSLGMEWAGDWQTFQEFPHAQNRFGCNAAALYQLLCNGGLDSVWKYLYTKVPAKTTAVAVPADIAPKPAPMPPVVAAEDLDRPVQVSKPSLLSFIFGLFTGRK